MTDRMLAGEFGAAARLTPKALRLYAELGLLVPAECDPVTGYRYYGAHQLPRARLIARLRRLELPLARIAYLVDLPPDARAVELRGWVAGQQNLMAERIALVYMIQRHPQATALVGAVSVRDVPGTKLLCRSAAISTARLAEFTGESEQLIRAHLRASGLSGDGVMRVHFQDLVTYDSEGTVEVAVPYEGTVEPTGDLHARYAAAHRAAVLPTPPGYDEYPQILHVYDAIEEWCAQSRATITGHPYERHPGQNARFDVVYPIREA